MSIRKITYCEAINEATIQAMSRDPSIFVYGIGVPDHTRIFGSLNNVVEQFGIDRCIDTPLSEDSLTGFGLGAAINGLRPINIHSRVDFFLLTMNQIGNMLSSYRYNTDDSVNVPIVIRVIVGRGWGQGCQHSKSCHAIFAHFPGLKIIMPTTPYDAKGLLLSAIEDNNPVICFEHRWLYRQKGEVDSEYYTIPIGKGKVIKEGDDITVVATSWMNVEALKAAEILGKYNISIEIIDPRTVCPLDKETIINSVNKTRKCIIADNDWKFCGFGSEIAAMINEECFGNLDLPTKRIGFAPTPCPTVRNLENKFYPNAVSIVRTVEEMLNLSATDLSEEDFYSYENKFKGPF